MQRPLHTGRKLLHEVVSEYISSGILSGRLEAGDRIVETRIAKELGISQAPVREAIRALTYSGLLEQKPYSGTYIREITVKDIASFYEIRSALEVAGARQCIQNITPPELETIEEALCGMEQAAQAAQAERYTQMDARFHNLIIEYSGNAVLMRVWKQCDIKQWLQIGTVRTRQDIAFLAKRHRVIFEAIAARDMAAAEQAITHHLEELLSYM